MKRRRVKKRNWERKYDGDDSVMFFDTRDNYISPKTLRENIKKKFNKPEYIAAVKQLLEEKNE